MFDVIETENRLLLIDETSETTARLTKLLTANYACDEADSLGSAVTKMRLKDYSVILSNLNLRGVGSLDLIARIQTAAPLSVIILLGENVSAEVVIKAFRVGVFDFLQTPLEFAQVETAVARAAEHYELKCLRDRYQYHLEELVSERTTEVDKALEEVETSYRITLKALMQALETRDFETHGHSERVVTFSLRLGHEIGLEKEGLRNLELGALLHDIGKIGVPDAILRKPAKLTAEEWVKMKLHPLHGQQILRNIPFLEGATRIVAQHHEQWDGSGYPYGIRGEDIDIGARIFAVVDAFDAMISDRVYRRGRPYKDAVAELERCAGTQFDALIVEAFKRIPPEDWEVLRHRSLTDKQEVYSFQAVVAELVYSRQQFEMVH